MRVSLRRLYVAFVVIVVLVAFSMAGADWWRSHASQIAATTSYKTPAEQNVYVRFDMEAFDVIQENYWQKASESDLAQFFALSLAKTDPKASPIATSTRSGVADMLASAMAGKTDDEKKHIAVGTLQVVLYNLPPVGHGELMTREVQTALQNNVANVNPTQDLYGALGLQKGASVQQADQAFTAKSADLSATTSPQGKQQLVAVQHAHQVLSNPIDNLIYEQTGAEPTVQHRIIGGHTLYVGVSKIAPTTVYELAALFDAASTTPGLNSLIIDMRSNLGGDLSFTTNFMSLFFGPQTYVYDLFHQGTFVPQRTPQAAQLASVSRFREIAILIDGMTQSTAELTASAMRHAHLAYIVGSKSRGWGSVEATYPLTTIIDPKETYAMLLVSYLTVRDGGLPIEGNGVPADVDIGARDWKQQLANYFYSPDLIAAIKTAIAQPPHVQQ